MRFRSPQFFHRSSFLPFCRPVSFLFFLVLCLLSSSPGGVVTYTFVTQRANIDKSVGTKTSEGSVRLCSVAAVHPVTSLPIRLPFGTPRRELVTRARTQRDRKRKGRETAHDGDRRLPSFLSCPPFKFMHLSRTVKLLTLVWIDGNGNCRVG